MDPLAVLKTLWHHKFFVLPVVLLTLLAAGYVYQFGPRSYEASTSYAVVNPIVPTSEDIEKKPELGLLNKDNPYLRSADPALVIDVLITRLNALATADKLQAEGLGNEYAVSRGVGGNGFVIDIRGVGDSEEQAIATATALGKTLESDLLEMQSVNGADRTYLFTSMTVSTPDRATELYSNRLRAAIIVFLVGTILVFGAVSLARVVEAGRTRRAARRTTSPTGGDTATGQPPTSGPRSAPFKPGPSSAGWKAAKGSEGAPAPVPGSRLAPGTRGGLRRSAGSPEERPEPFAPSTDEEPSRVGADKGAL
ncbi:hypothetical protein J2X01_001298 [Arthrobacter ginsengisoli]|uniref:Chain-length determining protein n=1 Tax=Arthrobacter ginsengisoli TaxID=1356565 RepID=A0ABU1UA12_9MICC|nr:chain-length determining protein [Arthrobacter ginsengisoli]MDR7082013.1 hypothetical protein [Arthrobacter ginsengisoli]